MNKLFKNKMFLTMIMFLSSMATGIGVAQGLDNNAGIEANIPFAFTIENTRLPAGNYDVVGISDVDSIFEMQNDDNSVAVLLVPEETKDRLSQINAPEMVFDKIGNKYFLRELQTEDYGYKYAMSHQEKQLEMQGQKAESHRVQCTHMKKMSKNTMKSSGY